MKIDIEIPGLADLIQRLEQAPSSFKTAAARALNRAGDSATTALGRVLAEETGLSVGRVREEIHTHHASPDRLEYTIRIEGGAIPLSEFDARQTSRGVSARPWGHRRVFPGTFEGPGGRVFKREGRQRLPIAQLWGPDLAKQAQEGKALDEVRGVSYATLRKRLAHEFGRLVKKGGGAGGGD